MTVFSLIGRLTRYCRLTRYYGRYGFRATVRRAGLSAKRALSANRMVLFYCDLSVLAPPSPEGKLLADVEEKRTPADLSPKELEEMTAHLNPNLASRKIKQRFARGAELWLIRLEGRIAGYGWTLRGCTIEPHYFPLAPPDVHLFDFHVFERFRGRGINPYFVRYILGRLATQRGGRAYIEAAEWNHSQLLSLGKTPFQRLGLGRKWTFSGWTIVSWTGNETVETIHKYSDAALFFGRGPSGPQQ